MMYKVYDWNNNKHFVSKGMEQLRFRHCGRYLKRRGSEVFSRYTQAWGWLMFILVRQPAG